MGERIDDRQAANALPVLQVLGEEVGAAEFDRRGEQQAIPPGEVGRLPIPRVPTRPHRSVDWGCRQDQ